ncbi:hypothetical protein sscle_13g093800 [Sclerotinia sclerotiorum 1980 UF-70]|uniref:Uncharacterized protein n=1 Tax=Sclerotinia sclerotiorum (strain ATCC 18683 / 1980 / Ss-1) TaxID=665079 RepID=A0A1D9QI42_SCLS1|nr:hypothetical protein sscle_13g093800 [Sclerotinia sclerotiorum 1980 UF-70]
MRMSAKLRTSFILGKSLFEKSSASGNLESNHDPDTSSIFEKNKSLHWWKPIVWMAILLLLGVVVGLGHHFAYQNLDQQPHYIISQTWVHNLGSAAAFLVKTSFTLTVMLALQEVLWFSFRKKAIKISLLDKLFTLSSNPFSFVPSVFINAPVATCLAGFAWFIPISAILSPDSLVVGPVVRYFIDNKCIVPTFAAASSNISFYQMVPDSDLPAIQGSNPGIQKLANQIFAQGIILDRGSPYGLNCSFQLSFHGPVLQCTQNTNREYMHESADGSSFYYAEDLTRFGEDENSFMGMDFTYYNHTKGNYSWVYVYMLCSPYNTTYDISVDYTNDLPEFYTNLTYNTPLLNLNSTQSTYPENFPWSSNSATLVREVYDNHLNGT